MLDIVRKLRAASRIYKCQYVVGKIKITVDGSGGPVTTDLSA